MHTWEENQNRSRGKVSEWQAALANIRSGMCFALQEDIQSNPLLLIKDTCYGSTQAMNIAQGELSVD